MDWGQPTFWVTVALLVVALAALGASAWLYRKQSKDLRHLERWKSHTEQLRAALEIVHGSRQKLLDAAGSSLLQRNEVDALELEKDINLLQQKLEPQLSEDSELRLLMAWLMLYQGQFRDHGTDGMGQFIYEVKRLSRADMSMIAGHDQQFEMAYGWLHRFVFRGAEQRVAYANLMKQLETCADAIKGRMRQ